LLAGPEEEDAIATKYPIVQSVARELGIATISLA